MSRVRIMASKDFVTSMLEALTQVWSNAMRYRADKAVYLCEVGLWSR
jgi:hypothetical protein